MGDEMTESRLWEDLPARREMDELMSRLDRDGLEEFQREMMDVIYESGPDERFLPILKAWQRSLRFLAQPDFREKLERSEAQLEIVIRGT
ncbi:MAG TPA: hypothetical protein VMS74_08105 [Acidimicrobiia bacterium]|nr:hypothetical protein [Acidimicrobiia bacterium]